MAEGATDHRATVTIHSATPTPPESRLPGTVTGSPATELNGSSGFSYDSIFIPDSGSHRIYAQMTSAEKNKISYRSRAVEAIREGLGLE